jgi:hypothetical protein
MFSPYSHSALPRLRPSASSPNVLLPSSPAARVDVRGSPRAQLTPISSTVNRPSRRVDPHPTPSTHRASRSLVLEPLSPITTVELGHGPGTRSTSPQHSVATSTDTLPRSLPTGSTPSRRGRRSASTHSIVRFRLVCICEAHLPVVHMQRQKRRFHSHPRARRHHPAANVDCGK